MYICHDIKIHVPFDLGTEDDPLVSKGINMGSNTRT